MRRRAYPYGRYLVRDRTVGTLGPELKTFIMEKGFHISKYDPENEDKGILIIAVNKSIREMWRMKKPPGKLAMILSGFSLDVPSFKDEDEESQRIGIEMYLWPVEDGTLLEIFILPYMSYIDHTEIYGITESDDEEITNWYLCEHTWEELIPEMTDRFHMEEVHRRG
ncbi:MAG: hypothetical protein R6U61_00390 [Thermoplasmata archaeon]